MINYPKYRKRLEKTYEDRMTVYRWQEHTTPWGETKQEYVEIHADLPCRISQKTLVVNGQNDAYNQVTHQTKLFVSPDVEIIHGDKVVVTRIGGAQFEGWAGDPFPYPTHQELILLKEKPAHG
jgi:hypothetical protein